MRTGGREDRGLRGGQGVERIVDSEDGVREDMGREDRGKEDRGKEEPRGKGDRGRE